MKKLLRNPASIITVNTNGLGYKKGHQMSDLGILYDHSILIENDLIKDIVPNKSAEKINSDFSVDLRNKTILPGLVECHTHSVFAGSRSDEFGLRLSGTTYEEIAKAGGGIKKTVKHTREANFEELVTITSKRIKRFIEQGITTLEIKSGYGLDEQTELKILRVIKYLQSLFPIDIIPTFLGAHVYPNEFRENHEGYLKILFNLLTKIKQEKLTNYCDAFCEKTAFSSKETDKLFAEAKRLGFQLRLHTDQFNNICGIDIALKHKANSVDHLEVLNDNDIKKLAESDTVCVLLPGVSYFLNYDFAPARKLIDEDALVAISTDFNPGSSHINNFHLVMNLAAIKMKMSIEEIISASTINPSKVLDMNNNIGSIEINKKADFSIYDTDKYQDIIYHVGENLNVLTIKNGNIIYDKLGITNENN